LKSLSYIAYNLYVRLKLPYQWCEGDCTGNNRFFKHRLAELQLNRVLAARKDSVRGFWVASRFEGAFCLDQSCAVL